MTSETDAEFVADMEWLHSHDWEAALPPEKLARLFALARRGAAAKADDRRKGVGCYASCEWTRDQHDICCPHFDPSILPPPPAGETND